MNPLDPDPDMRYEALATMRATCPVHQLAPGRFMAVDHDSVATGLRSVNDFGGSAGQKGLPEEDTSIAGIPEPRHSVVRRLINSVVAFHRSQQIEPYLVEFIGDRLAATVELAAGGDAVDVMPTFVEPIPPAAMARLLGFPEQDSLRYFAWGRQLGDEFGRAAAEGRSVSMAEGCPEAAQYVAERIAERRKVPEVDWPNDALSRFLTTEVEGARLSDRAVITQVIFSIGAGSDTTRNVLGSLLYRLAVDPELYAKLRDDRSLIEPSIEEALRLDPPAQFLVRECLAEQFELGGMSLAKEDVVMLSIGAANRDDAVFPAAESFDPTRENVREHLGFGRGPHICPGSALARLEMRLAIAAWCDAIETFELAPGFVWEPPRTGMLHGPGNLPLLVRVA